MRAGLSIFPRRIPSESTCPRQVGDGPLEACILGLQFLQSLCLIHLYTPIFLALPVAGLISDAQLFTRLRDRFPLGERHIGCTELVNDLFGVVSYCWHGSGLLTWLFITLDLD